MNQKGITDVPPPPRTWPVGAWILIGLGAALRLRFYFAPRSLWLDELQVANNLVEREFAGLTEPLNHGQIAPIGWLWFQKLAIITLGDGAAVMRLLALVAGLASMVLCYAVLRWWVSRAPALVGLTLFIASYLLVYYSGELKQYSTDLAASLVVMYLATRVVKRGSSVWVAALVVAGLALPWTSHPVVFMLAGAGLTVFGQSLAQRRWMVAVGWTAAGLAWVAWALVHFKLFFWHALGPEFAWLYDYWADAFWPMPPQNVWDLLKPITLLNRLLAHPGGMLAVAPLGLVVLFLGAGLAWRKQRSALGLAAVPIVLVLVASAMERYPFEGRLVLFLVPGALLLIAMGLDRVWQWRLSVNPLARTALYCGLALVLLGPSAGQVVTGLTAPLRSCYREETQPVLQALAEHYRKGDGVLLNYWAEPAWRYYHHRVGLERVKPVVAWRDDEDFARFEQTIQRLRQEGELKGRWWVVLSHFMIDPSTTADRYTDIIEPFGQYTKQFTAPGAWVGLYEFE